MQKSKISSSSASTPSDYVRYAPSTVLKAGTPAPDFTLHTTPDQKVSLSEFHGRPAILAFYPADWSPVCGDEVALFNEILPEFEKFNAAFLGLSRRCLVSSCFFQRSKAKISSPFRF
jgi:peroxiredoxin